MLLIRFTVQRKEIIVLIPNILTKKALCNTISRHYRRCSTAILHYFNVCILFYTFDTFNREATQKVGYRHTFFACKLHLVE